MQLFGHTTQLVFPSFNLYPALHVMQSSFSTPIIGVGSLALHPVDNSEHSKYYDLHYVAEHSLPVYSL